VEGSSAHSPAKKENEKEKEKKKKKRKAMKTRVDQYR